MDDDLNKLSATLSTMIRQQSGELQAGLRSVSAALERAADRLSQALSGAAGPISTPGAAAPPSPAGGGAGFAGPALVAVLVTNGDDRALPVRVIAGIPAAAPPGGGGVLGSILGGVGSFLGGIVGGVAAGISAPVVAAELIVVIGEAIAVIRQLKSLLEALRASVVEIVNLVFDRLTQAGIFPISKLIGALLVLIDTTLRLVLTYIKPVLDWVGGLLTTVLTWAGDAIHGLTRWVGELLGSLADWVGHLLNSLSKWLSGALPEIGTWLRDLLNFIMVTVVKPQIAELLSDLVRGLAAVLSAFVDYLVVKIGNVVVEYLVNPLRSLLGKLPGVDEMPPLALVPERDLGPSLRGAWQSVFPPSGGSPGAVAPTLKLPDFELPKRPGAAPVDIKPPMLPEYQPPKPALGEILSGTAATGTVAPSTPLAAPPASQPAAPTQISGGITVNVSADRIDLDTAPATARLIAETLMDELQRLMDRDRFRRGLPAGALA